MASLAIIISRILVKASGISIFAIILALLLCSFKIALNISISATRFTKLNATQSSSSLIMNAASSKSFSVNAGKEIFVSGKLIPFFEDMMPPNVTFTFTSPLDSTLCTITSILPSSIMMVFPTTTSPARLG